MIILLSLLNTLLLIQLYSYNFVSFVATLNVKIIFNVKKNYIKG